MFVITDRDRQHLLSQAQTAMDEPAADTLMASLYPGDPTEVVTKEYLGLRLDAAVARIQAAIAETHTIIAETVTRLETKIAETNTKIEETARKQTATFWRMTLVLAVTMSTLPLAVAKGLAQL